MSWETVKLGQIIKLEYGKGLNEKDRFFDGAHPAFGANGIKSRTNLYLYDKPSIIVGRKGSAGELTLVREKFWALDVSYYLVHDQSKTDLRYLYFALLTKNLPKFARGVKPGINRNDIYELEIPLPPLFDQQKIVTKLDAIFAEIDKAIAAAEANIKNAEALFQSYLESVFQQKANWITSKLKDVCEKITDGTHQTPTYYDEGVIFLSSKNVTSGVINWNSIKYIDAKQHLELSKRVAPKRGDVLLAKNGTTGIAAMVDRDVVFDIYVSLALLRAKDLILPELLLYFVNSPTAKYQFNSRLKGIGVPNLHLKEIREVDIYFPTSMEEQKKLVFEIKNFLEITSNQQKIYVSKRQNLILLKQSILQQAFNGELVKE